MPSCAPVSVRVAADLSQPVLSDRVVTLDTFQLEDAESHLVRTRS